MRITNAQITLDEGGFEMTFTQEETIRGLARPEEGVPYSVNPSEIDWTLFQTKRGEEQQEEARKLILKARANVDVYPQKYGKPFYTLMPEKTWNKKSVRKLGEQLCQVCWWFVRAVR